MDYIKKTIELHNHFGKNDNYVQAAGGNISIKDGDIIHIKKSGLHFKDIKDKNDVISLNISKKDINQEVLSIKNKKNLENRYNKFIDQKNSGEGRPSIELSFHIFGDKYTLHLHPTLINIFTCTKEGQKIIKKMCEDNDDMSYVDYYKPGIILTDEILKERFALNDITFLFNHGIIVTGPSEDAIKERYKSVENALKKEIVYKEYLQEGPLCELLGEDLLAFPLKPVKYGYKIKNKFLDKLDKKWNNQEKLIGIKETSLNLHLYPDSVIYDLLYVGQKFISAENLKDATFRAEIFINKMKIEHFAKLNGFTPCYLNQEFIDELKNWDAEKYRQDLLR